VDKYNPVHNLPVFFSAMDGQLLVYIAVFFLHRPLFLIYIVPWSKQHIKNTGKTALEFLCIVDPEWKEKDEEIFSA